MLLSFWRGIAPAMSVIVGGSDAIITYLKGKETIID